MFAVALLMPGNGPEFNFFVPKLTTSTLRFVFMFKVLGCYRLGYHAGSSHPFSYVLSFMSRKWPSF